MNLKELSTRLGLSQTTVSRALNGYPEVNESTRARVVAAAKAHGYRPNTRAKSLATGHAMAVGHVFPISSRLDLVNPIFADFSAGAATAYARHGYDMVISAAREGEEESVYRALRSRGTVDGLVVNSPSMRDRRLPLIEELGLPFVVHGRVSEHPTDYSWLDVTNRTAFRTATTFLLDLGHRDIALVNGIETLDFAHRRRRGFEEAMAARGLEADPRHFASDEMTEQHGYVSTMRMLALPRPPTAIVVSSMISAIGVRRAIEERGLAMGRDVSVITYDDDLSYLRNGGEVPIFTAMKSSVREAGERLAELLIERINDPAAPHRHILLEAELQVGRSTGPAPPPKHSA